MAEVGIQINVSADGSVEVVKLGDEFTKTGKDAEKSAKQTTTSWGKTKKVMIASIGPVKRLANRFVALAARITETVAPTIAVTLASRKMAGIMEENNKNIEENISLWSKFQKSLSGAFNKAEDKIKGFVKSIFSLNGAITTLTGTAGIGFLVKSFIGASSRVEDFRVRLISLTKSAVLAEQKLKQLSDFASKAPFELPEIIEAGITLEAFGAKIKNLIGPVGDLAAFMGVKIVDAAKAFGRAFAAGAGAADVLRERGVLAMVKLKAGVEDLSKLTLPEFRKVLLETMTDKGGKIFGATERLAKTFSGVTSMVSDALFNLKVILGDALMPVIQRLNTKRIIPLIKRMQEWAKENQKIIEQKFEQVIANTVDGLERLIDITKKTAAGTRKWWEENKNLIIGLGKLYIATKAAGLIIGVILKVAVAAKVFAFAKAIGVLTAGTTLLKGAMWLLKPALLAVSAGMALLVGFKVGEWLINWVTGVNKAREAVKDLEINTERLQKVAAKKLTALGFSDLKKFNEAVEEGIITYNKVSGTWEKVKESVNESLNAMADKAKEATDKIAGTWDEMGDKLQKSFESLDIFPKAKLDAQAKTLIDSFRTIVSEANLSNDDLLVARAALFDKLEKLNEKAGEIPFDFFAVGFDQQATKQEVERVFDEATGTATFRLKDMAEQLSAPSKQVGDTIFAGIISGSDRASKHIENSADTLTVTIKQQAVDLDQFISSTVSQAQNMFGALSASISSLDTEIPVSVIDNATPKINEIQASLDALQDKTVTITTRHIDLFIAHDQSSPPRPPLANGLDLVPRDMDVRVHRGERIQRADENPFNPDNRSFDSRQTVNNFNFNGAPPTNQMATQRMFIKALRKSQDRVF